MKKAWRMAGAIPVYPAILLAGGWILGYGAVRVLLLGLLAAGATALAAILLRPRKENALPAGFRRDLGALKKSVERIENRAVFRAGNEIVTELKQCETNLPYLSASARGEITDYYLPAFLKYFSAYATFEKCNEGNETVLSTMEHMEHSIGRIAENFRRACDRNHQTASLNLRAETAVLSKKLNSGGIDDARA